MSHYNPDLNALYIHVPKTAGSSMEDRDFLRGTGGHTPAVKYIYQNWFIEAYKFAFVRNPWDRFVSAFFHQPNVVGQTQTKVGFERFVKSLDVEKLTNEKMIEHIWLTYPSIHPWPIHHHFLPQWFFLYDMNVGPKRNLLMDFVGRYEDLLVDWRALCMKFGVSNELGYHRLAPEGKKYYTHYYTPELWDIVGKIYKRDCLLFSYWNVR